MTDILNLLQCPLCGDRMVFKAGPKETFFHVCVNETCRHRVQVENGLKHAGIFHYIDRIFTCTELDTGKHETKVFDTAREFMGTDIESTWVFEDARHAAQTAKSGGYKVCGIFDPSEPDQAELEKTADVYIRSFEEL